MNKPIQWIGTPMAHQREAVELGIGQGELALFHEPGCGKTYATVHIAKTRFLRGEIDLLVIMCPNSVKQVWPDQIAQWAPDIKTDIQVLKAGQYPKRRGSRATLEVVVVAIESLSSGGMYAKMMDFVKGRKAMCVDDESSRIKTPSASRSKNATNVAWNCFYRMILTGTPVTQGPHDLFSQFRFLDPAIIGQTKWTAFKARYCVMGGFENRQIVSYQNLDELMEKIRPYVHYVRLKDCQDIPEKIYHKIRVPLSKEQESAIEELKETGSLVDEEQDRELFVEMELERMTRIQQIVGGSLPFADLENGGFKTVDMPGTNPKMDALLEYVEDLPEGTKCLVWARFGPERERLVKRLAAIYGADSVARFDGTTKDEARIDAVKRMQEDPALLFIVGNQRVAGIGLTLTAAKYSLIYSNTFSLEDREQMENRNHRTGQKDHCVYVDFEANVKEDRRILESVSSKKQLSKLVEEELQGELQL